MEDHYSKVQCKDKNNTDHLSTGIPIAITKHLGVSKSLFIKWTINDDGIVTATKSKSKPLSKDAKRLKYNDWLKKIEPYIPTAPPGKNPFQILKEAGIEKQSISAVWVTWAKNRIGLNNDNKDPKTHQTLWYRKNIQPDEKDQKVKETTLREPTLGEFQVLKDTC
jgi:hypothetical protein